ncbi:MAG: GAF domain-containing protein [Anaerolineae bacterium]|nr:GAF domain-containing protein [Anaerolineae bacterium]
MLKRLAGPQPDGAAASLQSWRERILTIFLWVLVAFGSLAYYVNVSSALGNGEYGLVMFFTAAFIWVLAITLIKKTPYVVKAGSMLALSFAIGVVALSNGGLIGDGRIWLMFFAAFAGILFGIRIGIAATVIGTVTFGYYAWIFSTAGSPPASLDENDLAIWISTGVVLLWLTITVVSSIAVLLQGLSSSQSQLEKALEKEKGLNEELIAEHRLLSQRSSELEKSVGQIRTAAEISRLISAELDPERLMQSVVDLIKQRFNLYYAGVFLVDDNQLYADLKAGTGEPGRRMVVEGHRLSVGGNSMVGWATANQEARIALDTGEEEIRFNNPHLPLTKAELALPLLRGTQLIGALTIQSTEPVAFNDNDIVVLRGIADSLATAIENAQLFQQIETSLEEIQKLNRMYLSEGWQGLIEEGHPLTFTADGEQSLADDVEATLFDIPLKVRDQHVIGNISLEATRQNWSEDEMEFIEAVSNQAALALESARLLEESQKRVQREQTLNELTAKFSRSLEVDSLMQLVVRELGNLPNVREVSLHMKRPSLDEKVNTGIELDVSATEPTEHDRSMES